MKMDWMMVMDDEQFQYFHNKQNYLLLNDKYLLLFIRWEQQRRRLIQ